MAESDEQLPAPTTPETPLARYRRILEDGENTERLVFFSDAVMAIALTLLVLQIEIPNVTNESQLPHVLLEQLNSVYAFLLAFFLIAFNWISHHRKFKVIARYNQRLILINFGYLLFIAILPLPVRIMAGHGDTTIAVVIYGLAIAMPSVFQFWLWSYAWKAKLFSDVVDAGMYHYVRRNIIPLPAVFLFSVPMALLFGPSAGILTWFAIIPVNIVVATIVRRRASRLPRPRA